MDQRLWEAAIMGDVVALNALLKEDQLILRRVSLSSTAETPLHVASLAGHVDFVRKIMVQVPSFAQELNKDGFAPIHLATAAGHLEVAKELLNKANSNLCLLKDKAGRTAPHLAAIKGRVNIIDELLSNRSHQKAMEQVTPNGEPVLRLAVKNGQFEAFKVLFEASEKLRDHKGRVKAKDNEGKTVLEIANATNQLQDRNLLPVMGTMIAAATFQAGLNPPSTIWDKTSDLGNKCFKTALKSPHPGDPLGLKSCPASRFYIFMVCNTVAFAAYIVLIPFSQDIRMAPILTMISLSFLFFAYLTSLGSISPNIGFFLFIDTVMARSFFLLFVYKPFEFSLIGLFSKLLEIIRSRRTNAQGDANSERRELA